MDPQQKILLIDDDPLVAQLIGMFVAAFREAGPFTVDHAANYAGGLQRLLSGEYTLCVLDYRLGDGDGLEMLRVAKTKNCPTPIILLTGDTREETDLAAMERGAADFINKGELKADRFERAVDYAIKTAKSRAELQAKSKK